LLLGDRHCAEVEAMIMQFQEQIASLQADDPVSVGALSAASRFRYLPPVGMLPVQGAGSASGFNAATFFGAAGSSSVAMTDGRLLRSLWREALDHTPIDLAGGEKIQLYLIWENHQAVANGQSAQLALVFASAALPQRDVARWGYANYSLSHFAPVVN
jgi:hypothetical protein